MEKTFWHIRTHVRGFYAEIMTDNQTPERHEWTEEDRAKWIWRTKREVDVLHSELASLYRTKSNNRKLIPLLWRKIEEKEALLVLEGVTL